MIHKVSSVIIFAASSAAALQVSHLFSMILYHIFPEMKSLCACSAKILQFVVALRVFIILSFLYTIYIFDK